MTPISASLEIGSTRSAPTGEMKKRYGFIYVDLDNAGNGTLERQRKDSFYYYKKLIESNGACVFDE